MSATDREVKSATGVDLLVPLAAQSAEKKDLNNFNLVVVTTLAQYKPAKLIAAATVQVTRVPRFCGLIPAVWHYQNDKRNCGSLRCIVFRVH